MTLLEVSSQSRTVTETLLAVFARTLEGSLSAVDAHVCQQGASLLEAAGADVALEGSLAGVNSDVANETTGILEALGAVGTQEPIGGDVGLLQAGVLDRRGDADWVAALSRREGGHGGKGLGVRVDRLSAHHDVGDGALRVVRRGEGVHVHHHRGKLGGVEVVGIET